MFVGDGGCLDGNRLDGNRLDGLERTRRRVVSHAQRGAGARWGRCSVDLNSPAPTVNVFHASLLTAQACASLNRPLALGVPLVLPVAVLP